MAAKKTRETKTVFSNWHPDFRIVDRLPDVKVVRTGFIINFVGVTLPLVLFGLLIHNHITLSNYRDSIADLKVEIQAETSTNEANLKSSQAFSAESAKITDLAHFYSRGFDPLPILVELFESKPPNIAMRRLELRPLTETVDKKQVQRTQIVMAASLQGSTADALKDLNNYRSQIMELPSIAPKVNRIEIIQPRRNPNQDLFEFSLLIVLDR